MRNLILGGLVALGAAGCGGSSDNNNNNTNPDMAMVQQMQNPDLAPTCVSTTPASNSDFLNACTTSDSVEITPFYPANAPGGMLPPLQ